MFFDTPVRYETLGFGALIATNTLSKMKSIIKQSSKNYAVRELAAKIVEDVPQKDLMGELSAIYYWVQDHSRYVKDPQGTEMIQSPLIAMQKWSHGMIWQGDCDDFTVILLSLYRSIGFPVALRAAGYAANKKLSHVYGLVKVREMWVPVDGIKLGGYVGWEAPNATVKKDVKIDE